ncbi:zinc ribbon domain-containing protein [Corallococcus exiguus]|uniref:Tetratricopeptide repeat protein n=1 Tax=Corallococcus exiguus TaxID=83462 RepID=A0A7X4YB34_9BACT|nr:zinc ribbon domain-containing protein [Corallococcus exiguus]NBC41404.1 hypothetical protein [Corallococcus exiguus]TNV67111.1 zinc ribbon domain-containing protein [Corallococcus exiguus]
MSTRKPESAVSDSATSAMDAPAKLERGLSWRMLLSELGVAGPNCPSCGHGFEKMPQRKRACPKCSAILYSRKRAFDGAKSLLTETQARDDEAQGSLRSFVQNGGVPEPEVEALLILLHGQLGRVPTAHDVVAEILMRQAATHAEAWNWGLYRNARFNLAEALVHQGRREDALNLFLEVLLLDLNGPRNMGTKDPEIVRRFPPFDPSTAFLAPGAIGRAVDVMADLRLSTDEVEKRFISLDGSTEPLRGLPRSAVDAWRDLKRVFANVQR